MRRRDTRAEHTQDWKLELSFRKAEESILNGHLNMVMGGGPFSIVSVVSVKSQCERSAKKVLVGAFYDYTISKSSWSLLTALLETPLTTHLLTICFRPRHGPEVSREGRVTCDVQRDAVTSDATRHKSVPITVNINVNVASVDSSS